jgi:hypothetical protein
VNRLPRAASRSPRAVSATTTTTSSASRFTSLRRPKPAATPALVASTGSVSRNNRGAPRPPS